MTIASAIVAKQQQVADAYTACDNKGATMPGTQNLTNLANCIGTIPTGGGSPVITSLTVAPTTSAQTITAPSGTDGYSPVYVNAVTAAIDSNIKAGNIKSGVSILGVTGNVVELNGETRSVSITSTAGNTFTPTSGKNAITSITVTPNNQARSVTPSTSSQTLSVNSGYSGNGTISVSAVTSSIDANILPENIKKDVTILSVTGTYEGSGGGGSKYGANINTVLGDINVNGVLLKPTEQSQLVFTGVLDIQESVLLRKFYNANITSVSFPDLTTISGGLAMNYCFGNNTNLTSVSFPNLTTVSGTQAMTSAFYGCAKLTSVSFPKLATISGGSGISYAFYSCANLTSVSFPKLATISVSGIFTQCFYNCSRLANVYFNKLTTTSFGSYKNQFGNMFNSSTASTSGTVNVHFPRNLSSTISSLTGYPTFGGNSSRVVIKFDLSATS